MPQHTSAEADISTELPAYADTDGIHWMVWCEHERRWHRHGAGEGGRASHCLCAKGPRHYVLRYAGEFTTDVRKQHGRQLSGIPGGSGCWRGSCRFDRKRRPDTRSPLWDYVVPTALLQGCPVEAVVKVPDAEIVDEALCAVREECDPGDIRDVVQTAVSVALTRVREGS